jgi:3-phenylpropionate/trans-cinnamate dioxygenase ferredoxin component
MEFRKMAAVSEIAPGTMRRVEDGGLAILLANVGGTICAISDTCTHRGGTLSKGTLEGNVVRCPRHGSKFDVRTGNNVGPAKIAFIKSTPAGVRSYPVRIEGEDVLVDLGG